MNEEMVMEKPKGSKTGMWVLVIVLVAIVFGSAGYYVGKVRSKSKPETPVALNSNQGSLSSTLTQTAVSNASASTTPDATADWKTYTNDTYGFSFKYPGEWTVSEKTYSKPGDEILTVTSPDTAKKIADRTNNPFTKGDIGIRFTTMPATDSTSNTIAIWMADQFTNSITAKNKTSESIEGAQAYGAEIQADPSYYAMLVQANNGLFALDFGADTAKKSELSTNVSQILSTFKFTK